MSTSVRFLQKCCGFYFHKVNARTFWSNQMIYKPLCTPSLALSTTTPLKLHTSPPLCDSPPPSQAEEFLISALAISFPTATDIAVVDISGGCGSMYEIYVEAPDFKGLRVVKQHQLVTKALSSQIKDMHGIRISTSPSPCKPQ